MIFLCVEGIVLMNLLVSVLGDGFKRVKKNETAIRLHQYALFTDRNLFSHGRIEDVIPDKVKRYFL